MTFAKFCWGAALCASAPVTAAAIPASPTSPTLPGTKIASLLRPVSSAVRLEYTDFSKLYGDRAVVTAESKVGTGRATHLLFSLSGGQRRGGGTTSRATQATVAVDHDWSSRLSTHTAAGVATNGLVFARTQFAQDVSYKLAKGLVGTVGGKFATYGNRNNVAAWSAGAGYYLPGASFSYRYSLFASNRFGRSHAHLASVKVNDPGGSGATQLWVGRGTSLYELDLPRSANSRFTSLALQRSQPIGGGVALNFGVNRGWYRSPTGSYSGSGVVAGLSFSGSPF
jgi:YaiO family outer membrane protein